MSSNILFRKWTQNMPKFVFILKKTMFWISNEACYTINVYKVGIQRASTIVFYIYLVNNNVRGIWTTHQKNFIIVHRFICLLSVHIACLSVLSSNMHPLFWSNKDVVYHSSNCHTWPRGKTHPKREVKRGYICALDQMTLGAHDSGSIWLWKHMTLELCNFVSMWFWEHVLSKVRAKAEQLS